MGNVMVYDRIAYLNITPDEVTPTWERLGNGFTSLGDSRSPDVVRKIYLPDVMASANVRKYEASWDFEFDVMDDQDIHDYIRGIGDSLATGAEAESEYIEFLMGDVDAITGLVPARKYPVAIGVTSTASGAPGEELTCSGSIHANGDPVEGVFDYEAKTFTPDVS